MDIAAIGMVTALGCDAATSCAAARAGIVRSSVLENFALRSAVDGEAEPVIGHAVSLLTRGFEGDARLLRLLQGALADLLDDSGDFPWANTPHRFYLALPESGRVHTGFELVADDAVRAAREADAREHAQESAPVDGFTRAQSVLDRAAALAKWPAVADLGFVSLAGHAGGMEALRAAQADLASGAIDVAIVAGVDSLLDDESLNWLQVCGRLKSDASPAGLQPGEAAAALMLVAPGSALAASSRGRIAHIEAATEARSMLSGDSSTGEALARVLGAAWHAAATDRVWLLSDHNGENYRASELGHAIVRLRGDHEAFASPLIGYPVASHGDVGAATAMLGIITALHAFERRYAMTDAAIVAAASDAGLRAAVTVVPTGSQA